MQIEEKCLCEPHAGFNIDEYVEITSMGIEKNHDLNPPAPDVEKVTNHLASRISERRGSKMFEGKH